MIYTTTKMMEEAPASPRSAAIYYWGGDWSEDEKVEDEHDVQLNNFGFVGGNSKQDAKVEEANSIYDSNFFKKRSSYQHRRSSLVKFQLTLNDEGDADHWMYAAPPVSTYSAEEEKEFEEEEKEAVSIPEVATVATDANNDFANPNTIDGDFDAIPIIDLAQPKHVYAQQIGDACRNVGFFYIINHGVDQSAMDDVMDKSKKFFELDLESKLQVVSNSGKDDGVGTSGEEKSSEKKGNRGYFGIGGEDLENKDGTRDLVAEEGANRNKNDITEKNAPKPMTGDFKEGFDCGLEIDIKNDPRNKFFGKNIWPDECNNPNIIGFRKTLMKYQAELLGLSDKLLLALGYSLNDTNPNGGDDALVEEDYFINRSRNPMCTLRLLHYPPTTGDGSVTSQGCGAHTDYGLFTILQQDSIGGLQVRNRHKQWIDAKPLKGSFVINVGDMLSHWTNSEYSSTVHRVISPSISGDRYSVPFFFNPDHDAVVKPLKGIEGGNVKTAMEILKARYEGTFQGTK